ncbi:MAG TPA: hypothetical protein VGR25_08585 [bacterium]|jgi:hypothetical protein|nr:hypothetical protein [bacterium]
MQTQEARGWALVIVSGGKEQDAFEALRNLAVEQQWSPSWYIKRIDLIEPLRGFEPSRGSPPRGDYSLIAAVKARDEAALTGAFGKIMERMDKFSPVDGYTARAGGYDFNWP